MVYGAKEEEKRITLTSQNYKNLSLSNGSCPLLGQRIIEEISRQLFEHIFEVEPFGKLIIAPKSAMSHRI
jgi:hypothetical protein